MIKKRNLGEKDKNGIPHVLRDIVILSGMTQQEAATKIGVTTFALSKWENGLTTPSLENLSNIEMSLGVIDGRSLFPAIWPSLIPDNYR
jgi:transcriptional regulator with XRE-family HTH domain